MPTPLVRAGTLLIVTGFCTAIKLGPAPTPDLRYVSPPASDAANAVKSPLVYPVSLYPEIEPYDQGMLDVGDGHKLYYDVSGNPDGVPAVFLHGGPGAGCSPRCRRFFDPAFYRIVILDQRGSGKSSPNSADDLEGSLVENTTPKLVEDIEALRTHLDISKWGLVLGGSWGSTLALAYAQAHPTACEALLLRGVFLFGPDEVEYLFINGGTAGQNPQAWEEYKRFVRETSDDWTREESNLLGAYWQRLTCSDPQMRNAAAAAFVGYELSISKTYIDPAVLSEYLGTPSILIPFAVMEVHYHLRTYADRPHVFAFACACECVHTQALHGPISLVHVSCARAYPSHAHTQVHYMLNGGFVRRGQLLDNVGVMAAHSHRVAIAHGRADYVCRPQAAWRLSQALRSAGCEDVELEFVAGAGHSDSEPGLVDAMVRATDRFKAVL